MSGPITPLPPGLALPLAVMHSAAFPEDPWDAAALGRVLGLSGVSGYLAWRADSPAGFVLARDLGDEIEVLSLGVLPDCRRLGLGRALIEAVIAQAERRPVGSLVLEVATDNDAARRLYAACGFVQVGRRPRYYHRSGQVADGLILRRAVAGRSVQASPR